MDNLTSTKIINTDGSLGGSAKVITETVTTSTRLTSLPPKGASSVQVVSSSSSSGRGGTAVERRVVTQSSGASYASSSLSSGLSIESEERFEGATGGGFTSTSTWQCRLEGLEGLHHHHHPNHLHRRLFSILILILIGPA
ncbi:hypothetical protein AALO_G00100900 [Alosa alosa]|uniref:Uncharacterized protein n=1 Tax=Alosa alosa TaxID=278164 RepID=A0AAV6GU77_9TELE|nr:hypothetical protein AALO_G00100900 [Alosa alosa]